MNRFFELTIHRDAAMAALAKKSVIELSVRPTSSHGVTGLPTRHR